MTRVEAIEHAKLWVRDRYPVVPPVAGVLDFRPAAINKAERQLGHAFASSEMERFRGRWCVLFRCSWDTDTLQLPLRLGVPVDDQSGAAESFFSNTSP